MKKKFKEIRAEDCLELVIKQIHRLRKLRESMQITLKVSTRKCNNRCDNIASWQNSIHTQKSEKILNAARDNILIIFKEATVIYESRVLNNGSQRHWSNILREI